MQSDASDAGVVRVTGGLDDASGDCAGGHSIVSATPGRDPLGRENLRGDGPRDVHLLAFVQTG